MMTSVFDRTPRHVLLHRRDEAAADTRGGGKGHDSDSVQCHSLRVLHSSEGIIRALL